MAPSSKGKSQAEHVNTFNSLVSAYKVKPTDKMLSELDKVVVVLSKVSDLSVFDPKQKEGLNMLLHSQYLISSLESRNPMVWSIISLLSSIASASNSLATFLANGLCIVPTLARLLHSGPTAVRTTKLLEFLQTLAARMTITRREAFLTTLVGDLSTMVVDHVSPHLTLALRVLCHLTRGSYISAKTTSTFLPLEKLTTATYTQPNDQVSAEYLCFNLGRIHLSSAPPSEERMKSVIRKTVDVFCGALISETPLPTLSLLTAFLRDLSASPSYGQVLRALDASQLVHQVLTAKEFSDGLNVAAADLIFQFATSLISSCHTEVVTLYELVVRVLMARLESKPSSGKGWERVSSALGLLKTLVEETNMAALSGPEKGILKFQVEQVLPSVMVLALECKPAKEGLMADGAVPSFLSVLDLLHILANVPQWSATVGQAVQAAKLVPAYRAIMMGLEGEVDKARLATEFVTLATTMKAEGKWRKAREEVLSEPSTLAMVSSILRAEREDEGLVRKALDIVRSADYTLVEEKKTNELENEERWVPQRTESLMSAEQVLRIDQMLEKVADNLAQSNLEPVVAEIVELALARRGYEKAEVESLREALEGAAVEKQGLTKASVVREQRLAASERQTACLLGKLAGAREEVADLRGQHGELSAEADSTREKLSRQLQEKQEEIQQVKVEKEKLENAVGKYREKSEEQKKSLKQYEDNEKLLTAELKKEMKLKEEKEMKVKKGEEKLKKKERQLEEEQAAREKAEKEGEDLNKQCQQLRALSKSQEAALGKKEKAIQENEAEIKDLRKLQETIFNLSKVRSGSGSGAC